jgi:hypothetical protein
MPLTTAVTLLSCAAAGVGVLALAATAHLTDADGRCRAVSGSTLPLGDFVVSDDAGPVLGDDDIQIPDCCTQARPGRVRTLGTRVGHRVWHDVRKRRSGR